MIRSILFLLVFIIISFPTYTQTIWDGPKITFTKPNNADPTLEENQDRITDNVWITRGSVRGIYNIKSEASYTMNSSPADTEWAFGTTADLSSLAFDDWQTTVESNPPAMVDRDMVLHLISDDIYIDLKFLSWSVGSAGGGGFSYERSTDMASATASAEGLSARISVFPNPSPQGMVAITYDSGQKGSLMVSLFRTSGRRCLDKTLPVQPGTNNFVLDLSEHSPGAYFLQFRQGRRLSTHKVTLKL